MYKKIHDKSYLKKIKLEILDNSYEKHNKKR